MKQEVLQLLNTYPQYAIAISICLNIAIALLGVIPSIFLTAANVLFFGFWPGTLLSFIGEAIGALVAFLLYRFGFKKPLQQGLSNYPQANRLLQLTGRNAFMAILSLRLLPFVPSGIVTFASAVGKVSVITFFAASTIGKAPALLLEAYAAMEVTNFNWQGKLILALAAMYLIYLVYKRLANSRQG